MEGVGIPEREGRTSHHAEARRLVVHSLERQHYADCWEAAVAAMEESGVGEEPQAMVLAAAQAPTLELASSRHAE
jgi:hypothetical protein